MEMIRKQTVLNMLDDMQFERYHTHAELELMARIYYLVNDIDPVDAVEVVRCRDCKHWVRDGNESFGYAMFCKANCSLGGQGIKKPDDYCSYGERKTDG